MSLASQALRNARLNAIPSTFWRPMSSTPKELLKREPPVVGEKQITGPAPPPKRVTTTDLKAFKDAKRKFTMVTAYDYPSAVHADLAGIDVILVGDSVAMVELGMDNTLGVDMNDMIHHAKAVSRGARRPLLVGDMPFGSYECTIPEAVKNAHRFLKEAEMDCVKMEGGADRADILAGIVRGGVAAMGHIGLTPQAISVMGGFKVQGRSAKAAQKVVHDALRLQDAGAFALVLECVPPVVADAITKMLEIPTIGIGAGPYTNGQVLVYHDMLGMLQHPHHAKVVPKFMKAYAHVGVVIQKALEQYRDEVQNGVFPGAQYSPYRMPASEIDEFAKYVENQGISLDQDSVLLSRSKKDDTSKANKDDQSVGKIYGS
eukprot:TRINITY_DN15831_c0_g1::TRINITY_DN15831_c0_g1_i1::g.22468::m.22468 TRINITY_DN15831_c0_g1::TRINITY_DN15831_c0_g1_i1::g.22468  ORF type:complete len:374 (+),score=88.91,sp/O82357/PANB1_ARATH/58.05/3e-116,Pantoate_transf/PF02548.10/3e-102,PEP_mutase/PF13714.1/0.00039,PEP_mutase/PF13714.1/1.5e+03 TRINITY_DN15831_c0_g1_i1:116-1237(+)